MTNSNGLSVHAEPQPLNRVFQAVAVLAGVLAPLASRASVLILFGAVAVFLGFAVIRKKRPAFPDLTSVFGFCGLGLWAAISASWSITPEVSLRSAVSLCVLFGVGLLFVARADVDSQRGIGAGLAIGRGLVLGLTLGLVVYAFEWISGAWLTRFVHGFTWRDILDDQTGGIPFRSFLINGTAVLSLMLWPMAAALLESGHRWLAFILGAFVCVVTVEFGSDSGAIALVFGAICWLAAVRWGARAARAVAIVFALVVLAAPLALHRGLQSFDVDRFAVNAQGSIPNSALVRLHIWKFTVERIAERPLLGWGFNTARAIPGGGDRFILRDAQGAVRSVELNLPLHPHNQIFQIWLELGAVGALIVSATGALLINGLGRFPSRTRSAGLGFAAMAIVYDVLSFGAWQSWWIAVMFIVMGLLAGVKPKNEVA